MFRSFIVTYYSVYSSDGSTRDIDGYEIFDSLEGAIEGYEQYRQLWETVTISIVYKSTDYESIISEDVLKELITTAKVVETLKHGRST